MCARNHHSKWWHPFWLSTRMVRRSGFALGDDIARDLDNGHAERAARAPNHPTATAFHGCHRFQRCGVGVRTNKRRADACAKPPLEVVAPVLAVDSDGSALGRCARALPSAATTPAPACAGVQSRWAWPTQPTMRPNESARSRGRSLCSISRALGITAPGHIAAPFSVSR